MHFNVSTKKKGRLAQGDVPWRAVYFMGSKLVGRRLVGADLTWRPTYFMWLKLLGTDQCSETPPGGPPVLWN